MKIKDNEELFKKMVIRGDLYNDIGRVFDLSNAGILYNIKRLNLPTRNNKQIKFIIGQKIGNWELISNEIIKHHTIWKCKCYCGRISDVDTSALARGCSTHCKECEINWGNHQIIPKHYWVRTLRSAASRNLIINITKEYAESILLKQEFKCYFTGLSISFPKNSTEYKKRLCTASIDRIDNSKGYEENNICWVHKTINMMKKTLSVEEFKFFCKKVSEYDESARISL